MAHYQGVMALRTLLQEKRDLVTPGGGFTPTRIKLRHPPQFKVEAALWNG